MFRADMCKSSGVNYSDFITLLTWHYKSQHDHLSAMCIITERFKPEGMLKMLKCLKVFLDTVSCSGIICRVPFDNLFLPTHFTWPHDKEDIPVC